MNLQDKELQELAFGIYKYGNVTVDEAYEKAKVFKDVKKDSRGFDIVGSIMVSCSVKTDQNGVRVEFYKKFGTDSFEGIPSKKFSLWKNHGGGNMKAERDSTIKELIKGYALEEVNKVLNKDNKVAEIVDLYYYYFEKE